MIFIYDNVIAAMVGGMVLLLVLAMQHRAQDSAIERSLVYAAKKSTLSFAEVVEAELANAGSGSEEGFTELETSSGGLTERVTFHGKVIAGSNAAHEVSYVLHRVETLEVAGEGSVDLYEVRRYVDGELAGASAPIVRHWKVTLYREKQVVGSDKVEVEEIPEDGDPRHAHQVEVRLVTTLPAAHYREGYMRKLFWGTRLRPAALQ